MAIDFCNKEQTQEFRETARVEGFPEYKINAYIEESMLGVVCPTSTPTRLSVTPTQQQTLQENPQEFIARVNEKPDTGLGTFWILAASVILAVFLGTAFYLDGKRGERKKKKLDKAINQAIEKSIDKTVPILWPLIKIIFWIGVVIIAGRGIRNIFSYKYEGKTAQEWFNAYDEASADYDELYNCVEYYAISDDYDDLASIYYMCL